MLFAKDLKLDDECRALSSVGICSLQSHAGQSMRIETPEGVSVRTLVKCTIKGWDGIYLADKSTGTLYRETDGICLTSSRRRILGSTDESPTTAPENKFAYGYQQIAKAEARKRTENTKPTEKRGSKGRACGEGAGGAKITEKDVRAIRAKDADGKYKISIAVAAKKFGLATSSIASIRRGRTWSHVK